MNKLIEKSEKELLNDLATANKELFDLMLKKCAGKLERSHVYTNQRKRIAKIKTILKQKSCNFENKPEE